MLLDRTRDPDPTVTALADGTARDLARLTLLDAVRDGDGYVLRAAGRMAAGGCSRQLDISFGPGGAGTVDLDAAVHRIRQWCEAGTEITLRESGGLELVAPDGTAVRLPGSG